MRAAFQSSFFPSSLVLRTQRLLVCSAPLRLHCDAVTASMATPAPIPPRRIVADNVYDGMADAIGNTPLIKLQRASRETGCNIYGKAEFMNPVRTSAFEVSCITTDASALSGIAIRMSLRHDMT